MTDAYCLPCKKIIHAVAPIWNGGTEQEDEKLASCYRLALDIAVKNKFKSIAFPCIGTILYGYPKVRAAQIAIRIIQEYREEEKYSGDILICCNSKQDADVYKSLLPSMHKSPFGLDDVYDLKTKYPRGKEIYQHMQEVSINRFRIPDAYKYHATTIVHACSHYSYDLPIKEEIMFEFLERAETENKKVKIVPDDKFLPGGSCHNQCDGWHFHPILITKEGD